MRNLGSIVAAAALAATTIIGGSTAASATTDAPAHAEPAVAAKTSGYGLNNARVRTFHTGGTRTQATVSPQIGRVSCGGRTDWFRIWTRYHGFPACYANDGEVAYTPTWTTYGYCSGNNSGWIEYWVEPYTHPDVEYFPSNFCRDFSQQYGTVEISDFAITGH
ncbi:hypothetical protein ACFYZJ_30990 [Streptomyces sp. NPDC001848]|uniref:hypothetical protein n=1 Tax=Streptomyces sp. NPDC001848 TaxID=3364618 RepID=UPI0036A826E5